MSSKAKSKKQAELPSSGPVSFMRVLAVAAFLLSGYLAYVSLSSGAVAGCGPDSGCDRVLRSRWGYWFGIPVSVPALLLYGAAIFSLWRLGPQQAVERQRSAWRVLFPCGIAILGAALWFIAVQAIVLKSFCPWCMATHLTGSILALLILFNAPIRLAPDKNRQAEKAVFIVPAFAKKLGAMAALGVALLVAGQFLHKKELSKEQSIAGSLPDLNSSHANTNKVPAKLFEFYQGRFVVDLNEVPLIGSPAAPKAMVSLFDYTCHHCRETHPVIMETHRAFGEQLAIVSLPMPLDGSCNYTVKRTPRSHEHACEYARLGLAVWHANRKAHGQYDEFIFTPSEPPPIDSARQYAAQLVGGPANLEKALSDGWVDKYLKLGIDIYATNYIHVGNGSMPQIIVGSRLATGTVTAEKLKETITQQLGIQPRQ